MGNKYSKYLNKKMGKLNEFISFFFSLALEMSIQTKGRSKKEGSWKSE